MCAATINRLRDAQTRLTPGELAEIDRLVAGALPLRDYIRAAWPVIEPTTPMVWGWHIDTIAEHLEAVASGQIRKLIVNVPPRYGKSNLIMVCFPTWLWTFRPGLKFIGASYSHDLSKRDAVRSRRLIQSRWYQSLWGHIFSLAGDQNEKMRYDNNRGGYRIATSTGGVATGEGGDIRALDDPHKTDEVVSDSIREADVTWVKETWSSRVTDPNTSAEIVVMQRLHDRDVSGVLLSEVGGYVHLRLPGRFEAEHRCVVQMPGWSWKDPRTRDGELLWPQQWNEIATADLETALGSHGTACQIQQRPAPIGGAILRRMWFRYYLPEDLPRAFERTLQSWDLAFKKTESSSYVAGHVWAKTGARCFLLYRDLTRRTFTETIAAIRQVTRDYPEAIEKLVEDKANGPAILDSLGAEISGLIPVSVEADKPARMKAVSPYVEAGNVWLPNPDWQPWVRGLVDLLCAYPGGASNDDGDAMIQALNRLMRRRSPGLAEVEALMGSNGKTSPTEGLF